MSPKTDIKTLQSWWHIEDQISPSDGQIIREVRDITTSQDYLEVFLPAAFVGLGVRARNLNKELSYIEDPCYNHKFYLILGNLDDWPHVNVWGDGEEPLIKYEIKYTLIEPNFDKKWSGYNAQIETEDFIQPEFYLMLPAGLRIKELDFFKSKLSSKLPSLFHLKNKWVPIKKIALHILYSDHGENKSIRLGLEKPYILEEDHKRKYCLVIDKSSYQYIKHLDVEHVKFQLSYETIFELKYFLFPIVGITLSLLAFLRICALIGDPTIANISFGISYVIILVSFTGSYFGAHREGYNLPLVPTVYFAILFLIVLTLIEFSFNLCFANV